MKLRILLVLTVLGLATMASAQMVGINVVLNTPVTNQILADLGTHGTVRDIVPQIRAVTMQAKAGELPTIQKLPYVAAANPDQEREDIPINTTAVENYNAGLSTWDLDAINVTD